MEKHGIERFTRNPSKREEDKGSLLRIISCKTKRNNTSSAEQAGNSDLSTDDSMVQF